MAKKYGKLKKIGTAVGGLAAAGALGYAGYKYGPKLINGLKTLKKMPSKSVPASVIGKGATAPIPNIKPLGKSGDPLSSLNKTLPSMAQQSSKSKVPNLGSMVKGKSRLGTLKKMGVLGGALGVGAVVRSSAGKAMDAPLIYRKDYNKKHGIKESSLKSMKAAYRPIEPIDFEASFGRKRAKPDPEAWNYEKY